MTSSRTSERWTTIAALFMLTGQILLSRPAGAAVGAEDLLEPTPLVLKDGRIANVSIYVLPFDNGHGELAGAASSRLAGLTEELATDCFLTAQVIGHVSSREIADNQTLAAHRLARSRADAVQASLIGGGLPAKSIASVWDWQFLVREPRATLWVFRLIQGEDCEGLPLDGDASQLVAENEAPAAAAPARAAASPAETPARQVARAQPAEAPQPADPGPAEPAPAKSAPKATVDAPARAAAPAEHTAHDLSGVVSSASAAEAKQAETSSVAEVETPRGEADGDAPVQDQGQAVRQAAPASGAKARERAAAPAATRPETAGTQQADQTGRAAVPAGPASDSVPTVTRPLPAISPAQPSDSAVASSDDRATDTNLAALEPTRAAAGAQTPGAAAPETGQSAKRQGKVEWGGGGDIVITFATNSSYFPPGTARRLRAMLGKMSAGERYRVQLEVGVSGSDKVVGANTPEEARRYNRWLAERRMSRVREWLDENAPDRQLEIEPAFLADDSSRRLVVRVAPVS